MTENDIPADEKKPGDSQITRQQPNNPLHGITLEKILTVLRAHYSWKELNQRVELNCFFSHPSIKSSLTFLRKNDWARKKVENLYLELVASLESADPTVQNKPIKPTKPRPATAKKRAKTVPAAEGNALKPCGDQKKNKKADQNA